MCSVGGPRRRTPRSALESLQATFSQLLEALELYFELKRLGYLRHLLLEGDIQDVDIAHCLF